LERITNTVAEIVVNLDERNLESFTTLPSGTQTFHNGRDSSIALQLVINNEEIKKRCQEMGWSDMRNVVPLAWSVSFKDTPLLKNSTRPMQVFFFR